MSTSTPCIPGDVSPHPMYLVKISPLTTYLVITPLLVYLAKIPPYPIYPVMISPLPKGLESNFGARVNYVNLPYT